MTEGKCPATTQDRNHVYQGDDLDDDGCPSNTSNTKTRKYPWDSEHEEWIKPEIDESTDNQSSAIGPGISVRIEDTIDGV